MWSWAVAVTEIHCIWRHCKAPFNQPLSQMTILDFSKVKEFAKDNVNDGEFF